MIYWAGLIKETLHRLELTVLEMKLTLVLFDSILSSHSRSQIITLIADVLKCFGFMTPVLPPTSFL